MRSRKREASHDKVSSARLGSGTFSGAFTAMKSGNCNILVACVGLAVLLSTTFYLGRQSNGAALQYPEDLSLRSGQQTTRARMDDQNTDSIGPSFVEPAVMGALEDDDIRCAARLLVEAKQHIKPVLVPKDVIGLSLIFCGSSGRSYLEYGSGGSTRMATASKMLHDNGGGQHSVLMVEGSQHFLATLADKLSADVTRLQPGTPPLVYSTAPLLGPLAPWSYPVGSKQVRNKHGVATSSDTNVFMHSYPIYSKGGQEMMRQSALFTPSNPPPLRPGWPQRVFGRPASRQDRDVPEFVFVDGRFRVACVLRVIKEWGDVPLIMMDDFSAREWQFGTVLRFSRPWLGLDTFVRQGVASMMKMAEDGTTGTAHRKPVSAEELREHLEPLSELPVVGLEEAKQYTDTQMPKFLSKILKKAGPAPAGFLNDNFLEQSEKMSLRSMGMQRALWFRGLPRGERDEAALDAAIEAFSFIAQ